MSSDPFRAISKKTVHSTPWIRLEEHAVEVLESGHRFTYTYLASAPSVMVVGLTPSGKIPIVREYRYPSKAYCLELPGGGSRGFGSLEDAARNELAQETGWRAGSLEKVGEFEVYSGLSDEVCHVFLASELVPGEAKLDATESIEALEVSPERLDELIENGEFRDGMSLAALALARRSFEQLIRRRERR